MSSADSSVALTPESSSIPFYEAYLDAGRVPDVLTRFVARQFFHRQKRQYDSASKTASNQVKLDYIHALKNQKVIALNTKEANEQHYEVPTSFFRLHLGDRMKYSCSYYESGAKTLEEAEIAMLELYVERADIKDGMSILELGCGWGSLCLYLAERFPNSQVTAVSNSNTQREYITGVAASKGFNNIKVITADMNYFNFDHPVEFDRILSIEMFEHMKNYSLLFQKVSTWLKPETGRLFIHVFCHRVMPYDFKTEDDDSWMARNFFTGGTMPSEDLFLFFQEHVSVVNRWIVNGTNYGKTAAHWLQRLDAHKKEAVEILTKAYGDPKLGFAWFNRWRTFYVLVEETWNYNKGQEFEVIHYLFKRQ
ncbi:S-adenosyl-L-methionine-dependent methyltransferase [Polychytrium aggregatum]|uniref:S-adenosyl-L-methionine-dependent methyltransferase n=1 Tax=Polychytrium aggregatum TaxID=110093 RepID=UPI0022FEDDAE|nr:S-adenosyl-L-methionine-dependent methyltransferase [Polychytrium aggregatum]KAI9204086.1 S-adenosyl-L-methionine-dependent methyltransferase [Polychytrium aggregatum]